MTNYISSKEYQDVAPGNPYGDAYYRYQTTDSWYASRRPGGEEAGEETVIS